MTGESAGSLNPHWTDVFVASAEPRPRGAAAAASFDASANRGLVNPIGIRN